MDFSKVDQSFSQWANQAELVVHTEYQGDEVRSTNIIDANGQKWQVWLVPVDSTEQCVIHYWNYKDISRHLKVSVSMLFTELKSIEEDIRNCTVKNT